MWSSRTWKHRYGCRTPHCDGGFYVGGGMARGEGDQSVAQHVTVRSCERVVSLPPSHLFQLILVLLVRHSLPLPLPDHGEPHRGGRRGGLERDQVCGEHLVQVPADPVRHPGEAGRAPYLRGMQAVAAKKGGVRMLLLLAWFVAPFSVFPSFCRPHPPPHTHTLSTPTTARPRHAHR